MSRYIHRNADGVDNKVVWVLLVAVGNGEWGSWEEDMITLPTLWSDRKERKAQNPFFSLP